MTTTTQSRASWKTAATFRRLVELTLRAEGLPVEARPAHRRTVADVLTGEESHIRGLSRWVLQTNSQVTRDLSGELDKARLAAEHDGKDLAAVVWHRPGRDVGQAYVTIEFADFVKLVREQETER